MNRNASTIFYMFEQIRYVPVRLSCLERAAATLVQFLIRYFKMQLKMDFSVVTFLANIHSNMPI